MSTLNAVREILERVADKPRLVSQIAHAMLGANASVGANGSALQGAFNGLVLEGISNSRLSESLAGAPMVASGYALMSLGQLGGWHLTLENLFPDIAKALADLKKPKWGSSNLEASAMYAAGLKLREELGIEPPPFYEIPPEAFEPKPPSEGRIRR